MKNTIKQFVKYAIVGGSGVLLDLATLALIKELIGIVPWIAVALNQAIIIAYNFNLNKHWSFRNKSLPHWQFVRYMSLAGINYVLGIVMMYIFNQFLGYQYLLVRIGTIALSVAWNFLLYQRWVFREDVIHSNKT